MARSKGPRNFPAKLKHAAKRTPMRIVPAPPPPELDAYGRTVLRLKKRPRS